jgi:hypothetical protein
MSIQLFQITSIYMIGEASAGNMARDVRIRLIIIVVVVQSFLPDFRVVDY